MRLRRGALIAALLSLAGPALGEGVLSIGGAFGTDAGCAFFETGRIADDTVQILTPDTFTTHATGCYFETLVSGAPGDYALAAACTSAGEAARNVTLVVRGSRSTGYTVAIGEAGPRWGPLFECPGTAGLFGPPGVAA